jgi:hypothetical protein
MIALRIICLFLPLPGFIIAILFWLFKREDRADDLLFFSFIGLLVNVIILLPLFLVLRAMFF